jgi:signal transduction histidine kinase
MAGLPRLYDLEGVKRLEALGSVTILIRIGLTGIVAAMLWLSFDMRQFFGVFIVYALALLLNSAYLKSLPAQIDLREAAIVVAISVLIGLIWNASLVILWVQDPLPVRLVGIAGAFTLMIHALAMQRDDTMLVVADICNIAVAFVALTLASWLWLDRPTEAIALFVTSAAILIFFFYSLRTVSRLRRERSAKRAADMEGSRYATLGRLTGGVAHDFNNLLTVISGNLDLMREIDDPAELRDLAEGARIAAGRAAQVTANLLAYSRKSVLVPRLIDIEKSIEIVAVLLDQTLPKNIDVETSLKNDLPLVKVDPSRLESVLMGLCLNARDAMPDGGTIEIMCGVADTLPDHSKADTGPQPAEGYLRICVSDTGHGIAPEALPRVCEPYYSTKDKSAASGLGLSMVEGFAKQSGGALQIESQLAVGTRVTLFFPLSDAA